MQNKEGHYEKALIVYERMLALEMDQVQRANIQKRIGDSCLDMSRQKNDPSVCERAIAAYDEALITFSQQSHPIARAKVMIGLGSAYAALADHKGRAKNLKQAAVCWEEALPFFTPSDAPKEHASIQNDLGSTYRKLAELESREENGKKAIAACKASLSALNPINSPLQFAAAKAFLASSYLAAGVSANPEYHERLCKDAISAYQEAIELYSQAKSPLPLQIAALKNNLAIAFLSHSESRDREANCRLALDACRDALDTRTEKEHPLAYAATQNNLASAYLALAEEAGKGEGEAEAEAEEEIEECCRQALEACNNALRIYSRQESARFYATAQNNLANVYLTLGKLRQKAENRAENCLRAILAAQKALEALTLEDSPEDYGEAQGILWMAYLNLAEIEYPSENSALALDACEQRLHSYRVWQAHPLQIASCCKDLAMTAISLADNEITKEAREQDCKKAIAFCKQALRIYGESGSASCSAEEGAEEHAEDCAEAKILLWAAHSALAEIAPFEGEDRKESCLRAIDACLDAIAIYERIDPAEHADALRSLSYSYIAMAEIEEKADNCQRAIDACKRSLQYYTAERAPEEHADILRDLAYDYLALSEVQDKGECSNKALKACKKASRIYQALAEERANKGDPAAGEMKEKAERCQLSMQSCKAVLRAGRKAGPKAVPAKNKRNQSGMVEKR